MWYIYTKRADFTALSRKYGISPVTARIMINRGIAEADFETFLHGTVQDLPDPFRMTDMRKACETIREAIRNGKKIRIAGDYDVDGVCSTYLLVKTLREAGADVSWVIPDRVRDGYGINVRMIEEAARDGIGLIVTCDNGISAAEAAQAAADYGMDMVVTDHHEVPEILPAAAAVVDPKRRDDSYPFREICGGTVAWKLCLALESCGWPERITEETDIVFAAIAFSRTCACNGKQGSGAYILPCAV